MWCPGPEAELLGSRAGRTLMGSCWQAVPGKGGLGAQVGAPGAVPQGCMNRSPAGPSAERSLPGPGSSAGLLEVLAEPVVRPSLVPGSWWRTLIAVFFIQFLPEGPSSRAGSLRIKCFILPRTSTQG